MSGQITHSDARDTIASEALGMLDDRESEQLLAHVAGCDACQRELPALCDAAASLAYAVPLRPMSSEQSARVRARLLDRAARDTQPLVLHAPAATTPAPAAVTEHGRFGLNRWSGWMVAAVLSGLLATHHTFHQPLAGGWLAAGVLAVLFVAATAYAIAQRHRAAELRGRLRAAEQRFSDRSERAETLIPHNGR